VRNPLALLLALAACPPPAPAPPTCGSTRALNDAIRDAGITDAQRACMAERLAHPAIPDDEARELSTLLLFDARALPDDLGTWKRLAASHADRFPGDVSVLVQLARIAQREGPSGAAESDRWLDRAEAHADRYAGDDARSRTLRLDVLQLRAIAAEMQAPPGSELERRQTTAERSRAWIAEAVVQGQDYARPLAMCENAGPTREWCMGEDDVPRRAPSPDLPARE
jgi:hypothetical protein